MADSRRRTIGCTARIELDGDEFYGCTIPDVSDTGARIKVETLDTIPDLFVLLLSGKGSARRNYRVVWRRSRQIGVTFDLRHATGERASWCRESNSTRRLNPTVQKRPKPPDDKNVPP